MKKIYEILLCLILFSVLAYLIYLVLDKDDLPKKNISINLLGNTLVISKGNEYLIDYSINGNKDTNVHFTSSNSSIVSVKDNGIISALDIGNAIIDLSLDGISYANLLVYVISDKIDTKYVTLPSNIIVNDNINVLSGDEFTINYNVEPLGSYDLIKISSDSELLEINGNKVKALSGGNATIVLESVNGIKKYINVSITQKEIKVTALKILSSDITVGVGEDKKLPYEIEPSDATNKEVYITSSNGNVTVNSDGTIKGVVNRGKSEITIQTKDGNFKGIINVEVRTGVDDPTITGPKNGVGKSCTGGSSIDQTFNSCFVNSHSLSLSTTKISMRVGETKSVRVNLPAECGSLVRWTRRSADGQSDWKEYVDQSFGSADSTGFTWIITAKKKYNGLILSQTAQYDSKAPSGTCVGNVKSMGRLEVNIS